MSVNKETMEKLKRLNNIRNYLNELSSKNSNLNNNPINNETEQNNSKNNNLANAKTYVKTTNQLPKIYQTDDLSEQIKNLNNGGYSSAIMLSIIVFVFQLLFMLVTYLIYT